MADPTDGQTPGVEVVVDAALAAASATGAAPKSTELQLEISSWSTGILVFLVVVWSLLGPRMKRIHLSEGSAACALGLVFGLLLLAGHHAITEQAAVQHLMSFSAATFFTYLLPPVIFYAGLSIEKKLFFSHLGSILALGIAGTALTALLLAALLAAGFAGFSLLRLQDCLALGAIFSATDSVATLQVLNPERQPVLFSLVFGEGIINDATSVVLLDAVKSMYPTPFLSSMSAPSPPPVGADQEGSASPTGDGGSRWGNGLGHLLLSFLYLFFTSLALGVITGRAVAFLVLRFAHRKPHHEVALIGLLSYLSYLAAEVLGLSGILSLFCCGIAVSHFAFDNISAAGRTTTLNAFHTLSYLSEGLIFIYLGMDALDPLKWRAAYPGEALSLCGALLLLLLIARAASVLPVALLHNMLHPSKLSSTDMVIIWWAGLMRGAVSVALAYYYFDIGSLAWRDDPHRATLIAASMVVVLVSVMALGAATPPLMQFLVEDADQPLKDKVVRRLKNLRTCCAFWLPYGSGPGGGGGGSNGSGHAGNGNGNSRGPGPSRVYGSVADITRWWWDSVVVKGWVAATRAAPTPRTHAYQQLSEVGNHSGGVDCHTNDHSHRSDDSSTAAGGGGQMSPRSARETKASTADYSPVPQSQHHPVERMRSMSAGSNGSGSMESRANRAVMMQSTVVPASHGAAAASGRGYAGGARSGGGGGGSSSDIEAGNASNLPAVSPRRPNMTSAFLEPSLAGNIASAGNNSSSISGHHSKLDKSVSLTRLGVENLVIRGMGVMGVSESGTGANSPTGPGLYHTAAPAGHGQQQARALSMSGV